MLKLTAMFGNFERLRGGDMAQAVDLVRIAEAAGMYATAVGEHVSLSADVEAYPYGGGLSNADGGRKPYLEPAVLLGAYAAATSKIRLSTSVMLAPLRPAVLLAKQLATIDVLSHGRCEPVFGYGWSRAEYASLGVDFKTKRRVFRDNIAACRVLWGEQPASFHSETVSFEGLYSMPRPVQARIPILLGVRASEENATLIAELCDGWECGPDASKSPDKVREGVEVLRRAYLAAGRDPATLRVKPQIHVLLENGRYDLEKTFAAVPALLEAGATEFGFGLPHGFAKGLETLAELEAYFAEVASIARRF